MARKRQRNSSQEMLLPDFPEQQEEQMGGAAIPQPPQNWPQNEGQAIRSDSSANEEQSKRPRGPTMMHSRWEKDGGILHVELNNLSQAIGPDAARLSSKFGNRIWAHIKENTDATEDMRRMLMISVGSKWKEWKHEAKMIGYEPYNNDIERLAKCPDMVEEDQWRALVHYWSSNEAKMTKKNGVKSSHIEVFKETHTRKNKQPVNEIADETMKEMDELAKVYPQLNVPGSASNDVYAQVMGPDTHGNVRTLGKGAAPSFVYGSAYKRSQAEQRDFDRRVKIEVEKATSAMRIAMEEKLSKAKEEIEATEKKSLGITIGSIKKLSGDEQVSDNLMGDHQQSLSPVSLVHTKMVNIIKKIGVSEVGTKKKKRHS
ncbi:hypothetical protein A4A49_24729 [Nicotiana attenuata]|uniref:Uncharacterized protein n=1 Tax=Nicotiana attenuata TaxID=49451 RepID=A0A1J6J1M9_NICAT|nr:hypothetical protein A4A49_24729 [Nicotiana attenuata]